MSALIIDDEKDICRLLAATLNGIGIKSSYTTTLTDGWKKINSDYPEIIFLDINLPDGSGLDALEKIMKKNPQSKIIIISAYDSEADRKKAFDKGAVYFLGKPFNKNKIFEALSNSSELIF